MDDCKAEIVKNLGGDLPQLTLQVVHHADGKYTHHIPLPKTNAKTMLYLIAFMAQRLERVKDHFAHHAGTIRE